MNWNESKRVKNLDYGVLFFIVSGGCFYSKVLCLGQRWVDSHYSVHTVITIYHFRRNNTKGINLLMPSDNLL